MSNPNPNPSTRFKEWNPWRPVWSRSVETLFRDAIAKIAKDNPEVKDVERELIVTLLAKAKKWDMRALEMYLDRLYGKPKQATDLKVSGSLWVNMLKNMSDEELIKSIQW